MNEFFSDPIFLYVVASAIVIAVVIFSIHRAGTNFDREVQKAEAARRRMHEQIDREAKARIVNTAKVPMPSSAPLTAKQAHANGGLKESKRTERSAAEQIVVKAYDEWPMMANPLNTSTFGTDYTLARGCPTHHDSGSSSSDCGSSASSD